MEVTLSGSVILPVKAVQLLNALSPIETSPLGSVILVRELHFWNAQSPMDVTLSGIVISVRELHS